MAFCLAPQFAESDMVTLALSRNTHNLDGWMIIGRAKKMQRENDKQEISKMKFVLRIVTKYLFTIGLSSCLMMIPRALVLWHNNDEEGKKWVQGDWFQLNSYNNELDVLVHCKIFFSRRMAKLKTQKLFWSRKSDQLIQRLFTFFSPSIHSRFMSNRLNKKWKKHWSKHLSIVCFPCSTSRHSIAEIDDGNVKGFLISKRLDFWE